MSLGYSEKYEVLKEEIKFQRTHLMRGMNKKTVSKEFATKRIAAWAEILDDYRNFGSGGGGGMTKRLEELEARVATLEQTVGVGEKLIKMDGDNYIIPPDTAPWRAWHRRFVELNDPRIYKMGEIKVPSIWPEQH